MHRSLTVHDVHIMKRSLSFSAATIRTGDCCTATCVAKGFDDCTDGNTYCLDARYRYDCDFGDMREIDRGDGYCDQQLNTAYCNYDDGECRAFGLTRG